MLQKWGKKPNLRYVNQPDQLVMLSDFEFGVSSFFSPSASVCLSLSLSPFIRPVLCPMWFCVRCQGLPGKAQKALPIRPWRLVTSVWHPLTPVWNPVTSARHPLTFSWDPLTPVRCLVTSAWHPLTPVWHPVTSAWHPLTFSWRILFPFCRRLFGSLDWRCP